VTLWDNIDAIKEFSGNDPEVAVVEPEARAVLSDFDDFARHYEVVCASTVSKPGRAPGRGGR
jgi:hypothetical protein